MKKILVATVMMIFLCGCTQRSTDTVTTSSEAIIDSKTKINLTDKTDDSLLQYEGCRYDFDGDGADEEIFLKTDAMKDENGEYMWDDSHHWKLAVEKNEGEYVLYDGYVHGNLKMNVSEYYDEDGSSYPVIRLSVSTGASFEIIEYRYRDNAFIETMAYNTGYINELSIEKY